MTLLYIVTVIIIDINIQYVEPETVDTNTLGFGCWGHGHCSSQRGIVPVFVVLLDWSLE